MMFLDTGLDVRWIVNLHSQIAASSVLQRVGYEIIECRAVGMSHSASGQEAAFIFRVESPHESLSRVYP